MQGLVSRVRRLSVAPIKKLAPEKPPSSRRRHSNFTYGQKQQYINYGTLKLMVLGDEKVGKTSVCHRCVKFEKEQCGEEDFNNVFDKAIFKNIDGDLRHYDLEILEYSKSDVNTFIKNFSSSDGYILIYSQTDDKSFMKVIEYISDINRIKTDPNIVILGNKSDLKTVHTQTNEVIRLRHDHFNVSAKKDEGIEEALDSILRKCIESKDAEPSTVLRRTSAY